MRTVFALALSVALAGCVSHAPAAVTLPASSTVVDALQTGDLPPVEGPGYRIVAPAPEATVVFNIHWPERQVQAVPLSANTATIWIYDSQGRQVATSTAQRPQNGNLSSQISLRVKAMVGAHVVAKLYREATPTDNDTPIAMGIADTTFWANNLNVVALTLQPLSMPTIAEVSPAYGGVGQTLSISGINFGATDNLALSARISNVSATVTRQSDGRVTVTVPEGAISGLLELWVDGIRTFAPFKVLTDLEMDPFYLPLQAYRPVPLSVTGTFSDGSTEAVEAVDWTSSNPSVATVNEDGVLRPVATGSTVVTASSGQVSVSTNVRVTTSGAVVVARVKVAPSSLATLSVPIVVPSAAPGNLPVNENP